MDWAGPMDPPPLSLLTYGRGAHGEQKKEKQNTCPPPETLGVKKRSGGWAYVKAVSEP